LFPRRKSSAASELDAPTTGSEARSRAPAAGEEEKGPNDSEIRRKNKRTEKVCRKILDELDIKCL
jgi:hypothetical protein